MGGCLPCRILGLVCREMRGGQRALHHRGRYARARRGVRVIAAVLDYAGVGNGNDIRWRRIGQPVCGVSFGSSPCGVQFRRWACGAAFNVQA